MGVSLHRARAVRSQAIRLCDRVDSLALLLLTPSASLHCPTASASRRPRPDSSTSARSQLRAGRGRVPQLQVRLSQRHAGRRRVFAPDRDLERVDGFLRASAAQVNAADEQMRLGLVRREVDGAPELHHRLAVLFALEQPPAAIEVERSRAPLLALGRVDDRLFGPESRRGVRLGHAPVRGPWEPAACPPRRAVPAPRTATRAAARAPSPAPPRRCCPTPAARPRARSGHRRRTGCAAALPAASKSPPWWLRSST